MILSKVCHCREALAKLRVTAFARLKVNLAVSKDRAAKVALRPKFTQPLHETDYISPQKFFVDKRNTHY